MSAQRISAERFRREAARIRGSAVAARDEDTQSHLLLTARLYEQMADSLPKQPRPPRRRNAATHDAGRQTADTEHEP